MIPKFQGFQACQSCSWEDRVDAVLCTVLKQAKSESRLAGEFSQRASTQIDAVALASVELFVFVGEDGGIAANPSLGP